MEERESFSLSELDQAAARAFVFGGACFGFAIGWAAHAAWAGDWPALALIGAATVIYLLYCRYREARSIDIGNRDERP